jgi:hypothetical protein
LYVSADVEPTLSADEVAALRDRAQVPDVNGRWPAAAGYVPTYTDRRLRQQAAEAWMVKAAKVAAHYDTTADGSNLSRSQKYRHCMEMARYYREASGAAVVVPGGHHGRWAPVIANG